MAQHSIGKTSSLSDFTPQAPALHSVFWFRLACGLTTLLGAIISFFALSWDVQWHTFVGRDRTLTPPHLFLLGGIIVCGIGALTAVIIETQWAKNNRAMEKVSTPFADRFAAPLGIYISGYAALNMAVAFPLDQYWHTLYGVDVAIWAPFHIMVIAGLGLEALGAVYTLVAIANMATRLNFSSIQRVASVSAVISMATSLATLDVLAVEGIDPDKFIPLGTTLIDLYPALQGLLLASLLIAIAYAFSWKWAATCVVGVVVLFMGISQLIVPPALTWLMGVEQLTLLPKIHDPATALLSVLALTWPPLSLITAILIDICVQVARKRNLSRRTLSLLSGAAVLIGCFPFVLENPTTIVDTLANLSSLGIVLTIVLIFPAIYVGMRLGQNIGETMSVSER